MQAVPTSSRKRGAHLRDADNPWSSSRGAGSRPTTRRRTARLDSRWKRRDTIDENFFRHPARSPSSNIQDALQAVARTVGLNSAEAESIANRLPSYFVHALNEQWRERPEDYKCLKEAFDTPFTKAGAAEQAWQSYAALLQKQVDEPMFVEAFSLRQVYVPLRAYYLRRGQRKKKIRAARRERLTQAHRLNLERNWRRGSLRRRGRRGANHQRGPGSGKSSLRRMLSAKLAEQNARRVLFVPLHLLELSDDLEEAVRKFIATLTATSRTLDPKRTPYPLSSSSTASTNSPCRANRRRTRAQFVREVLRKIDNSTSRSNRLKVCNHGARKPYNPTPPISKGQSKSFTSSRFRLEDIKDYHDTQNLLGKDQRQQWWRTTEELAVTSTKACGGVRQRLLSEITSQPLLTIWSPSVHPRRS